MIRTPDEVVDVATTGAGTLAGRYLRRFWLPVARLDDTRPGRARPIRIMSEAFTFYRGETGTPHLIASHCAHRGTQLSTGWVEGDCLRCFYHGWKYDATGRCVEQPAEDGDFASKVRIAGYPTRAYLGLVFAYLGEGEPPPFPRLAAFERPGYVETTANLRPTNYFNQLENSVDQVHVNFVHRRGKYSDAGANREIPAITGEETGYGIIRRATYRDGKERIGHILFPIAMYTMLAPDEEHPAWYDHVAWRVPVDDERHISFMVDLIELDGAARDHYVERRARRAAQLAAAPPTDALAAAVLRGELHVDEIDSAHPGLLTVQDDVALVPQPPLGDRPPDRLGRSDLQVILLRRLWARELRALATGSPLTDWRIPDDLRVTSGV